MRVRNRALLCAGAVTLVLGCTPAEEEPAANGDEPASEEPAPGEEPGQQPADDVDADAEDPAADPPEADDEPEAAEDDEAPTEEEAAAEASHMDLEPEEFRQRWNDAVADLGLDYEMTDVEPDDEYAGYDVAETDLDGLGRLDTLIHPDGPVATAELDGVPEDEEAFEELLSAAVALIAAAGDLSTDDARALLSDDLGVDAPVTGDDVLVENVERDGVTYYATLAEDVFIITVE